MLQIQPCLTLFNLPVDFNKADLKKAYRLLVSAWHPDQFETDPGHKKLADVRIKEITTAYQVLKEDLAGREARQEEPEIKTRGEQDVHRKTEVASFCYSRIGVKTNSRINILASFAFVLCVELAALIISVSDHS